jgi:hypothetical protein
MLADEGFAPKETIATICECLPEKWIRGGGERAAIETPWARVEQALLVIQGPGHFFRAPSPRASRSVNPLHKRAGTLMRFR